MAIQRIEKTVFISYRRTNGPWALAIFQNLRNSGYDVFFDYTGIASGDFEMVIMENIRARAHFIVLLTPSALECCGEPGDWLRREIEAALETRRNIVPLMLEGFDFGTPSIAQQLTGKLEQLKKYNALRVPFEYFEEAMDRLRQRYLNVPLDAVVHPAKGLAKRVAEQDQAAAEQAPPVQAAELTAQQWFEQGYSADDLDEKLRCYSETIRLQPGYAEAFSNRGLTWVHKGDRNRALCDFEEAIKLKPNDTRFFVNRGNIWSDTGNLNDAIRDYEEAIRLKPDSAVAFYNRGNAYLKTGNLDRALRDYEEAIRLKHGYTAAFTGRGLVWTLKGDLDSALRDYGEAIKLNSNDAEVLFNRGNVLFKKGDLDGALRDYDEAIRLRPDSVYAFYSRSITSEKKGNLDEALRDLNEALRLKPDFTEAASKRDLLLSKKVTSSRHQTKRRVSRNR